MSLDITSLFGGLSGTSTTSGGGISDIFGGIGSMIGNLNPIVQIMDAWTRAKVGVGTTLVNQKLGDVMFAQAVINGNPNPTSIQADILDAYFHNSEAQSSNAYKIWGP